MAFPGAWLRPAHRWITLRLRGMELRVERTASGWQVAGFGNSSGETHASLESLPVDLDLSDLRVDIVDDATGRSWRLLAPSLRVVNVGDVVRFTGNTHYTNAAAASGAFGAARGTELRLLPINKESAGAIPLPCSSNNSRTRLRYFSLTQSRTKRLGA